MASAETHPSACSATPNGEKFQPFDSNTAPQIETGLPPELWTLINSVPATFPPQYFLEVSRNLLENPNLTASYLSRAELSYSSFTDASYNPAAQHPHDLARIIKHLKPDHQPLLVPGGFPGYALEWTVVRKLIPRNPKLDAPLLQTCHLFISHEPINITNPESGTTETVKAERYLVVYIPHASTPEEIPFYHPTVRQLAILYTWLPSSPTSVPSPGTLSLFYTLFHSHSLTTRLSRTALKMLEIIHKHSRGRMAGYQKRVQHDVIISQKRFQDRYVELKGKYAKELMEGWVEQTPAEKHVFEDLGIAAFLIEVWGDMYGADGEEEGSRKRDRNDEGDEESEKQRQDARRLRAPRNFPGFVDIGCGNGLLVSILNREGWRGWGFDARRRKTWDTFDVETQAKLKEMLLVPEALRTSSTRNDTDGNEPSAPTGTTSPNSAVTSHNGIFPPGTFIISNHADELTLWTPLIAHLSSSPFLAIPCCSHDFGGTRFRARFKTTATSSSSTPSAAPSDPTATKDTQKKLHPGKQPSAYASLCSYLAYIASEVGYVPEKEFLRIPSTRNVAILGRKRVQWRKEEEDTGLEEKLEFLRGLVEQEMPDCSIEQVWAQWVRRGGGLVKEKKGGGH
ncbi:DUF1613-domain-containing protein [Westerdykella ornata]|uniref:tRNA (uracil-O(2)-)-methyltransferase n=1 Tax=Westerdykella ornata TaxID=318751 RepID=A0A6A6K0M0_WESOR|nr:DUF1613-domain-containing protein [Westerdykella ornata]KAF2281606.1 DUF1613-domain-containing protein [Westerdykella ornata]